MDKRNERLYEPIKVIPVGDKVEPELARQIDNILDELDEEIKKEKDIK